MTDLRAAAQQALECIERLNMRGFILADFEDEVESAITALREALAQPEPPPEWEGINNIIAEYGLQAIDFVSDWKAAQRPWQGLTDEERKDALVSVDVETKRLPPGMTAFARAVEAKLKERNT